jgi:hypothetical protein
MRTLFAILFAFFLSPSSLAGGKGVEGPHEFRLSPLERQDQKLVSIMTGGAKQENSCGTYVRMYVEPIMRSPQVLFAVATPAGEPYRVIGRRARDIVFRNAPGSDMATVIGDFAADGTVLRYTLYLPDTEFLAVRECLKPRQVEGERDL